MQDPVMYDLNRHLDAVDRATEAHEALIDELAEKVRDEITDGKHDDQIANELDTEQLFRIVRVIFDFPETWQSLVGDEIKAIMDYAYEDYAKDVAERWAA